jgi:hypothetical protein
LTSYSEIRIATYHKLEVQGGSSTIEKWKKCKTS